MARDELQVIDRTYQLLKWFLGRLEKFPRSHRYGLGRQIEERLYAVFDGLLRANYAGAGDKRASLCSNCPDRGVERPRPGAQAVRTGLTWGRVRQRAGRRMAVEGRRMAGAGV